MKQTIFWAISLLIILSGWANAQSVPPPPTPIAESDLRDNTIKMRSIDLERVKRDAEKMRAGESTKEREIRFAKIKVDFENIQKLQDSIIKAYTTGRQINYSKIRSSATSITKNALRLDENLFGAKPEKDIKNKKQETIKRKSVRDLIIELDIAIGNFVKSPIFQNTKVVDTKVSKEAQSELEKIMKLSNMLSNEAGKKK
jgi:hypothetical protein